MPGTVKDQFKKIDRLVFQVERAFVVAALAVMSVVVFLDVVHRTFASEENKGVAAFVKLLGYFGQEIERGGATYTSLESWFPYALWIAFVGLGVLGIRTANTRNKMALPKALVFSVVGVVAVYGLIRLFVTVTPNGVIWAPKLALVLTLWVGFVAASMCTHENKHLKVEAAQRAIPDNLKPYVVFVSSLFTAAVCLFLMWLSLRFVLHHYDTFVQTEGRGGRFEGLGLPNYLAFVGLPLSFSLMTIRFLARALFALGGELPAAPGIEGIDQLEKHQKNAEGDPRPSEVPTEVGSVSDDVPKPQSQVQTDPHGKPKPEAEADAKADGESSDEDDADEEDAK